MKIKKLYFLLALSLHVASAQAQEKLVALSFDDGPNTTTTVHMLDVLKKHQVKASFFVIGKKHHLGHPTHLIKQYKSITNLI